VQTKNNLADCQLFRGKYRWIPQNKKLDNGGMLALYLNTYMKNEIGKSRDQWTTSDYDNAFNKLPVVREYVERILKEYMQS